MASAAVAAPAVEAASAPVEAAKAGLPSGCVASRSPSMAEPAEGAGMCACLCVRGAGAREILPTRTTSALRIGAMIEIRSTRTKTVAIDDRPAM